MKVKNIRLQRFRSFVDSGVIELAQINVIIGRNNSGKSSILRGLHNLQNGLQDPFADVRVGGGQATIDITLSDAKGPSRSWGNLGKGFNASFKMTLESRDRRGGGFQSSLEPQGRPALNGDLRFEAVEPENFIVPFLSKRKSATYDQSSSEQLANEVPLDASKLTAKLARIGTPSFPHYEKYAKACESLLGFVVTATLSPGGQLPGIYLQDGSALPIEQMGAGVLNIVFLLVNLVASEDKLFLLEEPENDLHPAALRAVLDLIKESSKKNQFVISTHSNIVVSHLCGAGDSRLFKVTSVASKLPTESRVDVVEEDPESRIAVLEELGYSFADFGLWDGWLILEESSAERIIRDYLIPWFAPGLTRIRTFAAGGVDNVEPAFSDFHRMVLFTHLMPAYAGRAWVRVDGDDRGKQVIKRLEEKFSGWNPGHFACFKQPQFEMYYPAPFLENASNILKLPDRRAMREAKAALLSRVVAWLDEDADRSKEFLMKSAGEIIEDLRSMEKRLVEGNG